MGSIMLPVHINNFLKSNQATMFFLDPSGNALEFKAFRDIEAELFAT